MRRRIEEGTAEDEFVAKARVYVAMLDNPGTLIRTRTEPAFL